MLRLPPTRLPLSPADIKDYEAAKEKRLQAEKAAAATTPKPDTRAARLGIKKK